jgi:MFS family permease
MRSAPEQANGTETRRTVDGSCYGWVIVVASLVLLVGSFGTQICFGVFLKPLAVEFGWTRAATSGAMSLAMGISGAIGVFMGRLTDKFDVRIAISIAMAFGATCYVLLARMHSLWEFYLFFGLGAGLCIGSTYAPVSAIVSKWFHEKRALALGVALMGIGLGQMVLSPVSAHLIERFGWRTAYVVLGIVIVVCALPALFLLGRRPPERRAPERPGGPKVAPAAALAASPAQGMTIRQAAGTAPFWMIMITGVAIAAGYYMFGTHLVPAATDLGIASTAAALVLTVSGIAGIPGTVAGTWWLTKKLGHRWALMVLCAGQALMLFFFALASSLWAFYVVGIVHSFCFASSTPVRQAMAPLLFGLRSIGAVLGYAYLAWSAGAVAGPYLGGLIFDLTQSYDLAFILAGALLILGLASILLWGSHTTRTGTARRAPAEARRETP